MKKDYYFEQSGFITTELKVTFCYLEMNKKTIFFDRTDFEDYDIIFIQNGNFTFVCNGKTTVLSNGDVFIARPFENYYIIGEPNKKSILQQLVIITFNPTFFKFHNSETFLKPFNERKRGENNVFRSEEFKCSVFDNIISPMRRYIDNNLAITNFAFAVGMMITELSLCFAKKCDYAPSLDSHEYRVKVYDYIARNYCRNITINEIAKKFSVSKWYINQTTKEFYNMSFHETIKSMRMWEAKRLMKEEKNLQKVSSLCGYSDYSGFYRCYLKFFGVSPKDDAKHLMDKGIFLSHDNRD